MKKYHNDIDPKLIDSFYNESDNKNIDNDAFNKLNKISDMFDIFNEPNVKINAFEFIQKANEIRNKKRNRKELAIFMLVSITFIAFLILVAFKDFKLIIICQIIIYLSLPLTVVPLLKFREE
ncbi:MULTISPECIES: DUF5345 family protein [Thermoanaerobacterium]|uniref:YxlC family protein n=2 Tax=Thermoanaerobacterium TaxID=28895 RepID=W9EBJ1_9THEO|nr:MULTISPECIES: DUF5345 family protein [Thermoanaerobacterium]AFK86336.1 hypothetical protein Tsac_1327 [Thermoanaerobacterium saccharolyticum JW/SL-YS485]ETO39483.1 hypothetical protein V518_0353 [Thermoanaerobacterium aotearoense SCUT27]